MATPVVTGAAALVLSTLSALTGNTTGMAASIRQLLLDNADVPATAVSSYGRRLNVASAVCAAGEKFAPAGMPVATPNTANRSSQAQLTTHSSFVERYYVNSVASGWQTGAAYDYSTRAAQLPLGGFKYGTGYTARFTADLLLSITGLFWACLHACMHAYQLALLPACLPACLPA